MSSHPVFEFLVGFIVPAIVVYIIYFFISEILSKFGITLQNSSHDTDSSSSSVGPYSRVIDSSVHSSHASPSAVNSVHIHLANRTDSKRAMRPLVNSKFLLSS